VTSEAPAGRIQQGFWNFTVLLASNQITLILGSFEDSSIAFSFTKRVQKACHRGGLLH